MRKSLLRITFFLFVALKGNAQKYENTWFISGGQSVNYSSGFIAPGGIPAPPTNSPYTVNSSPPPKATIAVSK